MVHPALWNIPEVTIPIGFLCIIAGLLPGLPLLSVICSLFFSPVVAFTFGMLCLAFGLIANRFVLDWYKRERTRLQQTGEPGNCTIVAHTDGITVDQPRTFPVTRSWDQVEGARFDPDTRTLQIRGLDGGTLVSFRLPKVDEQDEIELRTCAIELTRRAQHGTVTVDSLEAPHAGLQTQAQSHPLPEQRRSDREQAIPEKPGHADPSVEPVSGRWAGHYLQSTPLGKKHEMQIELCFEEPYVYGYGQDLLGGFTLRGQYDVNTGLVQMAKRYIKRHIVWLHGCIDGPIITGFWCHRAMGGATGRFEIHHEKKSETSWRTRLWCGRFRLPVRPCPHCGSRLTLKPASTITCSRCGHECDPIAVLHESRAFGLAGWTKRVVSPKPRDARESRDAVSYPGECGSVSRPHVPRPCRQCGYDLTGLPSSHTCPECGRPFGEPDGVLFWGVAMPSVQWYLPWAFLIAASICLAVGGLALLAALPMPGTAMFPLCFGATGLAIPLVFAGMILRRRVVTKHDTMRAELRQAGRPPDYEIRADADGLVLSQPGTSSQRLLWERIGNAEYLSKEKELRIYDRDVRPLASLIFPRGDFEDEFSLQTCALEIARRVRCRG